MMRSKGKYLLLYCVTVTFFVSATTGCVSVGNISPPTGMPPYMIDLVASDLGTDMGEESVAKLKEQIITALDAWSNKGLSGQKEAARFRITHHDYISLMYPWMFLSLTPIPLGQAQCDSEVEFQVGDKLYTGKSSHTYLFGMFYARIDQLPKCFEKTVKEAIARGAVSNVLN